MKTRQIGNTEIQASAVALGCWAIGGTWWGGADDKESIKTIQTAIDAGITLIDTAPVYGFGRSESVVGQAIQGRRDRVIIASKCGLVWDREGTRTHYLEGEGGIQGISCDACHVVPSTQASSGHQDSPLPAGVT